MFRLLLTLFLIASYPLTSSVIPGIEQLFKAPYQELLRNKKVAILTNQTGVTSSLEPSHELLKRHEATLNLRLVAIFAPEHGFYGAQKAAEKVNDGVHNNEIPIYSLHGDHRRPTREMLKHVDIIVIDIQDIGSRSYTYASTVFYVMEEAAKEKIPVIIADRPNPINGIVVDGPMLEPKWRSFIGYINVPYCHGMTIGELAKFFNAEYKIGCDLTVVPMEGWNRKMTFTDTGLPWIPTSPNIPEPTTTYFYPLTGIMGELQLISIGVGYTLPFKIAGAPWIDGELLARKLNEQKLPGIAFQPFHFTPFQGRYCKEECEGVLVIVTDHLRFQPVTAQYTILGMLKSLYPTEVKKILASKENRDLFHKVNGTERVYRLLETNPYPAWSLRQLDVKEREQFKQLRKKYLIPDYS